MQLLTLHLIRHGEKWALLCTDFEYKAKQQELVYSRDLVSFN